MCPRAPVGEPLLVSVVRGGDQRSVCQLCCGVGSLQDSDLVGVIGSLPCTDTSGDRQAGLGEVRVVGPAGAHT